MEDSLKTNWEVIAATNNWYNHEPLLLYNADPKILPGFPHSRGYIRNLVTGKVRDDDLARNVFKIGKFPAIRISSMNWLATETN